MNKGQRALSLTAILAMAILVGGSARAAELLNFKPIPISPSSPEFSWTAGPNLIEGPGSVSNGDGTLPTAAQTPGGLQVDTPFLIPGVPGSQVNVASTSFFDCTFDLTGFAANGAAIPAAGNILQFVNAGSFTISSTTAGGGPLLLLSGTISGSTIVGPNGGNAGAFFTSTTVTYTGGLIFNAMIAANGTPNNGDVSISFNDVTPPFSIAPSGFMAPFDANATGLFRYVENIPEPTSLALMSLVGLGIMRRKR